MTTDSSIIQFSTLNEEVKLCIQIGYFMSLLSALTGDREHSKEIGTRQCSFTTALFILRFRMRR